ncbi:hypothetical protein ACKVMT_13765 [Halobacteriales archaeon Cl-PHB]
MVDAELVAAIVVGVLLAAIGGVGSLAFLVGAVTGATEWSLVAWLLVLAFVGGSGITTYAVVVLAGDLLDTAGEGLGGLTEGSGLGNIVELLD